MAEEPEWGLRRDALGIHGLSRLEDGEPVRVKDNPVHPSKYLKADRPLYARWWNEDLQSEALSLQEKFGILREYERTDFQVQEYPDTPTRSPHALSSTTLKQKERERNLPCPCGSGTRFRKCCGRNT